MWAEPSIPNFPALTNSCTTPPSPPLLLHPSPLSSGMRENDLLGFQGVPGCQGTHLQPHNPLVHVLPHAHLHVKLREFLVGLGAGGAGGLAGGHVLGEIQHVPTDWDGEKGDRDEGSTAPCTPTARLAAPHSPGRGGMRLQLCFVPSLLPNASTRGHDFLSLRGFCPLRKSLERFSKSEIFPKGKAAHQKFSLQRNLAKSSHQFLPVVWWLKFLPITQGSVPHTENQQNFERLMVVFAKFLLRKALLFWV